MNKRKVLFLILMIPFAIIFAGMFQKGVKADSNSTVTIYRLYNSHTGEHFYTASAGERDSDVKAGWKSEGIGWVAPTTGAAVYRVYNPNAKGGDHYYTESKYEATSLVKKGWRWDNGGKAVFYSGGKISVYVAYNPNAKSGAHNYTTNTNEQSSLLKAGWKYGAISFKAAALPPVNGYVPGVQRTYTIPGVTAGTTFADNLMVESDVSKLGAPTLSLEADMNLSGSGNGYHAKLMIGDNNGSQVSLGIQVDNGNGMDNGVWRSKPFYLTENIANGGVHGGGTALYTSYGSAPLGKTLHLKIAYYASQQIIAFYSNSTLIGSQKVNFKPLPSASNAILNKAHNGLTSTNALYMLSVQGAAKVSGDNVNAKFTNITASGIPLGYNDWDARGGNGGLNWWNILARNYQSSYDNKNFLKAANVIISGTNTIPSPYDWDVFPGNEEPVGGIQIPAGIPNN